MRMQPGQARSLRQPAGLYSSKPQETGHLHCLYGMGGKAHLCAMRENKVGLCGVGDQLRPIVTFNQEQFGKTYS